MTYGPSLLASVILAAPAALGQSSGWTLAGDGFRATVSRFDGRITGLSHGGRKVTARAITLRVRDEDTQRTTPLSTTPGKIQSSRDRLSFDQNLVGLAVRTEVHGGRDLEVRVTIRNLEPRRRAVSVEMDLSGIAADMKPFLPGANSHPPLHPAADLIFGYRADGNPIVFPAATFSSASSGAGVTVYAPIQVPAQPFEVRLSPAGGPQVSRKDLRLEAAGEVATAFLIAFHEPDWRAGLAAIRDRYPEAFNAHDARAVEVNGSFLWTPLASDGQVKTWRDQGIRWVELIFTAPFIGEFAAAHEPWSPAIDDQWHWEKMRPDAPPRNSSFDILRRFMERQVPPWMTYAGVRKFIDSLHQNGIRAFIYFQPSTTWSPFGLERFPDDVARDREGHVIPDWLEQIAMNPRPGSRWGAHVERQFEALLNALPDVDGIFMDQSHFDFLDYAHDDGLTLRKGRTAYRMGYAISRSTSRLVEIARARGKMVWWNGPWMAEMGAPGDGHLAEASEAIEALQYFGLGNKPITTGATSIDSYDRVLLAGAQPAAPILSTIMLSHRYAKEVPAEAAPPADELALFHRYKPLFDAVRLREWLLEPDAVRVPEGFEANAFRNPAGKAVFPIVTSHAEPGAGWRFDLPVEIRVATAGAIRSALVVTPECGQGVAAKFERAGNIIRAIIPRHRRASVLILSATDETARPRVACAMSDIESGWIGSHRLYAGESTRAEIFVANHTQTRQVANLSVSADFVAISGAPSRVSLEPGERKQFPLVLTPRRHGIDTVRLTVGGRSAASPLYVQKQRMARTVKLLSARIEFEGWIPDGSPDLRSASYADQFHVEGAVQPTPPPVAPREVRVNGRVAGFLPSLNDAAWRNLGPRLGDTRIPMQVKLPDAVMLGLERSVRVVFRPSHSKDDYRLRKVALRLRFSDGSTSVSEPLGEFRTMRPGADLAAPVEMVLTLPQHFSQGRR